MMKIKISPRKFPFLRAFVLCLPAAALVLCFITAPLHAQLLVKPVNLTYLARRADVIVLGQVTDVVHESLPGYPNIPTVKVTLKVENMMRGPEGDTYTFREVFVGLRAKTAKKGYTAVAMALYWKGNKVKCEVALAKGKQLHDKRATVRERDWKRQQRRALKHSA